MNPPCIEFLSKGMASSLCAIIGIIYDYLSSVLKEIPNKPLTSIWRFLAQGDRFWTLLSYEKAKVNFSKSKREGKTAPREK